MTDPESTRVCPLCAETIRAAAKVCPHCRNWQRKWSLQNPQVGGAIMMLAGLAMLISVLVFIEDHFTSGRSYAEYQDQISIRESHVSHRMGSSNLLVTVVGIVTNRSEFGWKELTFEVQMFDELGTLIDVITHPSGYSGVTIAPYGNAGFKIEGRAAHQESRYAAHKVSIRWAKDIEDWP